MPFTSRLEFIRAQSVELADVCLRPRGFSESQSGARGSEPSSILVVSGSALWQPHAESAMI